VVGDLENSKSCQNRRFAPKIFDAALQPRPSRCSDAVTESFVVLDERLPRMRRHPKSVDEYD